MPQIRCYVSEDLAKRLQEKARHQHVSVSKYLAGLVEKDVSSEWPEGYLERVLGSWEGEPLVRPDQGEFEERDVGTEWPDGFFDLAGSWAGEPLERPPQGEFEQRASFD